MAAVVDASGPRRWRVASTKTYGPATRAGRALIARDAPSANDPKRTLNPLVSGSLQSLLKTAEQVVVIVWLAQEANRTSLHDA